MGTEAKGVEAKGTEGKAMEAKGVEVTGTETKGTEAKGEEGKGAEAKGVEVKEAEGQEVEAKGTEARSAVMKSRAVEVTELGLPEGCRYVERMDFKSVMCSGPNITTVPSFPLARQVESLHFTNTGIQMVSDVSGLPRLLKALAFTAGNLAIFDGSKLHQLPDLTVLTLDDNSISSWSFSTFLSSNGSTSPVTIEYLSIVNNLITYPPDPSGGNTTVLPRLETLVMNDNPMCNLPGKLFQPLAASPVTTLYLRNCSLSQFYGSPLEPLKGLRVLDLSTNMGLSPTELTDLLAPLQGGNLTELYLANNNYGSVPTDALALVSDNLRVLDLHGSAFECLDNTSFPFMPRLLTLNLKYCRINSIRQDTFRGFQVLEVLNLDGNGLVTIPTEVLLPSLKVLTLSENPRSTGSGSPESFTIDRVDFGSMTNLTNLTFQEVPLGGVEATYFNDLRGLLELRLTACSIAYIQPFSFANLSLLQRLHLDQNELRVLSNHTFTGLVSLLYLNLSGNTIIFHSIIDFGAFARPQPALNQPQEDTAVSEHGKVKSRLEILSDLPQAVVRLLQGREIESVKDVLNNPKHEKETQDMKYNVDKEREKKAEKKDDMNSHERLAMNVSRGQPHVYLPFKGLQSLRHLDVSDNEVWTLTPDLWYDLDQLVTLDLDSNDIQAWHEPVFTKLTNLNYLILSKNSLSLLTKAMVEDFSLPSLTTVDLRYNPFQCSCAIMSFNDTLNSSIFVDFSTYRCTSNEDILYFYEYINRSTCIDEAVIPTEMPTTDGMTVQIIIITVSILVSIIMTSVTVYKKRWYIRYLVHRARMRRMTYKDDPDHLYDIFICYSQADRQWVFEHLVAKLEDGGRYRVCVHERDFTVGQEITDNIISSVEKSRKVVMVLSSAFVESSWCMFELQLASNKILDERKNKLILILLTPLPSQNQPKKLRLLLRTRTYLPWVEEPEGQRLFWVRLMRTVAKPSVSEDPDASTYL